VDSRTVDDICVQLYTAAFLSAHFASCDFELSSST